MPHEITVPPGAPYVLLTVDEPFTREFAAEVSLAAKRMADSRGLRRFLYDLRLSRNVEGILTNYEYVHRDLPVLDLDRSVRSAVLVAPDDHSHDFVETLFFNAGYAVRIFRDEESAIRWLNV